MAVDRSFVFLVLLAAHLSAEDLEKVVRHEEPICSQGLTQCRARKESSLVPPPSEPVKVLSLDVKAILCCETNAKCKMCVWVKIHLKILPEYEETEDPSGELLGGSSEGSSGESEDKGRAAVTLCYVNGPNVHYKTITFNVTNAARENGGTAEVIVLERDIVFLGSTVNVSLFNGDWTVSNVSSHSVRFPTAKAVCPNSTLEDCKAPTIHWRVDEQKGVVHLEASVEGASHPPLEMCVSRHGLCQFFNNWTLPLQDIAPCVCFQAWTKGTERSEICPFKDKKVPKEKISLSVTHQTGNRDQPALSWTLHAPCRMEAELWLCRKNDVLAVTCREVNGSRIKLSGASLWKDKSNMLGMSGVFDSIENPDHQLYCVKYKVDGEVSAPVCPPAVCRWCWKGLIFLTLVVFCLAAVGVCLLSIKIKGWISKADKAHGTPGQCCEVLLVHSSGSDPSLSDSVSRFGDLLSELGFSVSLDLWNQAAVSKVGPTPWLHSKLNYIQAHGGKVLLLLSREALHRAKACWDSWNGETEESVAGGESCSYGSDVYEAALGCVYSAHLKGGATERFALVQLDTEELTLPELFHDLRLYHLPSESRCLLTDLHTGQRESIKVWMKRFIWTWRAARGLERGLKNHEEKRSRAESMLTQTDIISMGNGKEEETLPLQT